MGWFTDKFRIKKKEEDNGPINEDSPQVRVNRITEMSDTSVTTMTSDRDRSVTNASKGDKISVLENLKGACYNLPPSEPGCQFLPYILDKAEFDISRYEASKANDMNKETMKNLIADLKTTRDFDAKKLLFKEAGKPWLWWVL